MAWFGQGKDTIEWEEYRPDVLFYKWKNNEIKKGARLIIRPGQKAIFYANGKIEGVFEQEGNFDIATEITPFLSTLSGWFQLRRDTGMRAEVYFVNSKELSMPWGTRQRIMIPTAEVPSGIPIGCNGNLVVEFRDYLRFISKVAGVKNTYSLADVSDRILAEVGPIVTECILGNQGTVGLNALVSLQANNRALSKRICEELDKELFDIGLGARDVNIISINYPEELQKMAEKIAGQSFVTNVGNYAAISMADGMSKGDGAGIAGLGAQAMLGAQMAQQMQDAFKKPNSQPQQGENFCTKCRKMVNGKFCPECGTPTV